jgi:hypothetical protein
MTTRILIGMAGVVAVIGAAHADDPYALPPVGTQLTYRSVSTTKFLDKPMSLTSGEVYTDIVTAVDGPTMQGTIKPVAMIYGCPAGDARSNCVFASKAAGAKRDGDLVTVPVPDDIGDGLAKESSLKTHYFLAEDRKFPVPGAKNPGDPSDPVFGVAPLYVLTSQQVCDYEKLEDFLPFGKTERVRLSCHKIFGRTQTRDGIADRKTDDTYSVEFSYRGAGKVSLPSGEWDVQKVTLKFVPSDDTHPSAQSDFDIAAKLGIPVSVHTLIDTTANHITSETTTELIAIKP